MKPTVAYIKEMVAERFEVPPTVMAGRRLDPRSPHHVPRQVAMFLARHVCIEPATSRPRPMSYPHIGRIFRRDHTTIIHAERKVLRMMEEDAAFRSQVEALKADLSPILTELGNEVTSDRIFEAA